jgi:hypothetical protein
MDDSGSELESAIRIPIPILKKMDTADSDAISTLTIKNFRIGTIFIEDAAFLSLLCIT